MTLSMNQKQLSELDLLKLDHPELALLATDISGAFDPEKVENPELAQVMIITLCRRLGEGQPLAADALLKHLLSFDRFGALSHEEAQALATRVIRLTRQRQP